MSRTPSPRAIVNRPLLAVGIGLVLIIAALLAFLQYQSANAATHSLGAAGRGAPASAPGALGDLSDDGGLSDESALTAADGLVPDGVTVFDDEYPAVSKLDSDLLAALRDAASDAADDGVVLIVNSGWRSARYQQELLMEAIVQYGSAAEAARWVATPQTSPHVSGEAVDVGPTGADSWLSRHGTDYGLCQIYRNEPWHFELRPQAIHGRCPAPYADPTQDPRMAG